MSLPDWFKFVSVGGATQRKMIAKCITPIWIDAAKVVYMEQQIFLSSLLQILTRTRRAVNALGSSCNNDPEWFDASI